MRTTMGIIDKIANVFGPAPRTFNILLVGLDNSGKTSVINSLKVDGTKTIVADVPPTVGVQLERIKFRNCILQIHDMSGQGKYRAMWERCFADCAAIVFVVDSADRMRIAVVKDEFEGLMENSTLRERLSVPLLVLTNKKSQPGAMPANTISQLLELDRHLVSRAWHLHAVEAMTGEGVVDSFTWLIEYLLTAPIPPKGQD